MNRSDQLRQQRAAAQQRADRAHTRLTEAETLIPQLEDRDRRRVERKQQRDQRLRDKYTTL